MAWDKDRPYMPVNDNGSTMLYAKWLNPSKKDIAQIYETGGCEFVDKYGHKDRFIPFKEVRLKLRPTCLCHGRSLSGIEWRDENDYYYMFADAFNALNHKYHEYAVPIDGYWSAEKRGEKYGIRLVRLAGED